ncbi:hypothetical protein JQV27_17600 [Sulfitobacter mediterraneus]|uniref:hypothetical protein n=1 Tax=Sulfitobacter mediterraneus TaxID=83219 RepID=UPI001933A17D|nr:hypothetical protein [Sulfitobacter mediterraneus]MBM1634672.1 hypothetical protein [Sulfitobacter mediterraneus]MBM1642490.1 hypothetical protein [Sulfitobacter mediterraneus]MBM1646538.1 hypothetical protein [Sulfitobacter mediterraneus]MBM1650584.1 hypothetical protein [Sulfitobacter mediterraneus]MBM1654606.1 hypothetical protein [Sulfitobacter mediterraneus]
MSAITRSTATLLAGIALFGAASAAVAQGSAHTAIDTFNAWCFKAGQTEAQARVNMGADDAPFALTFWDDSLEPRPTGAPDGVERRCEVAFDGDHSTAAIKALRIQMAKPPVFGTKIPLPKTHAAQDGTALIEGRELLRGRVAVVQVGTRTAQGNVQTYMGVDRLYAGLGLPKDGS